MTKSIDKLIKEAKLFPCHIIQNKFGRPYIEFKDTTVIEFEFKEYYKAVGIAHILNTWHQARKALEESFAHHEYCNWGDKWERDCSEPLQKLMKEALNTMNNVEGD